MVPGFEKLTAIGDAPGCVRAGKGPEMISKVVKSWWDKGEPVTLLRRD
jgi:hypothetical protein